jgi:hypothetical protein
MEKENKDINKFIADICSKDYKEANVSLHQMIENKLKERIKQCATQKNN